MFGSTNRQQFQELLSRYWNLAYNEGAEDRNHDTPDNDAQQVLRLLMELFDQQNRPRVYDFVWRLRDSTRDEYERCYTMAANVNRERLWALVDPDEIGNWEFQPEDAEKSLGNRESFR